MVAIGIRAYHNDGITLQQLSAKKFEIPTANDKLKLLIRQTCYIEVWLPGKHYQALEGNFIRMHPERLRKYGISVPGM